MTDAVTMTIGASRGAFNKSNDPEKRDDRGGDDKGAAEQLYKVQNPSSPLIRRCNTPATAKVAAIRTNRGMKTWSKRPNALPARRGGAWQVNTAA